MDFEQVDISQATDWTTIDIWLSLCNTRFLELCEKHYSSTCFRSNLFIYDEGDFIMNIYGKINLDVIIADQLLCDLIMGCPGKIYVNGTHCAEISPGIRCYEMEISNGKAIDFAYLQRLCNVLSKIHNIKELDSEYVYKPILHIDHGINRIELDTIVDMANQVASSDNTVFKDVYLNTHIITRFILELYQENYFIKTLCYNDISDFLNRIYKTRGSVFEVFTLIKENLKPQYGL